MQPNGQTPSKLSDKAGYIFSHGDFSLSNLSTSLPTNSNYSISLSLTIIGDKYKWLYLDLIYFDIASSIDCAANTNNGLVIREYEKTLDSICMNNMSMPERVIQLNSSVVALDLEYSYRSQTTGGHRRGFVLFYKSKLILHSDNLIHSSFVSLIS